MLNLSEFLNENIYRNELGKIKKSEMLTKDELDKVQRFKIDDLMTELEAYGVSKTRRKEVLNFFEEALGPAPYYCLSTSNKEAKDAIKIVSGRRILDLYEIDELTDDMKEYNNYISSLSEEEIEYIKNLQAKLNMKIKGFKDGYRGLITDLKCLIANVNGKYIPMIYQSWQPRNAKDFNSDLVTYYVSCKDIDNL